MLESMPRSSSRLSGLTSVQYCTVPILPPSAEKSYPLVSTLPLHRPPLLSLPLILFPLLIQELPLFICRHLAQPRISFLPLCLFHEQFSLFSLLLFVQAADLLGLILAGGFGFAHGFRTEMGRGGKLVRQTEESGKHRSGGRTGIELHRKMDALLRDEIIELLWCVDRHVADDEGFQIFTSVCDSLNHIRGEQGFGYFSALRHDSRPCRQLRVILRAGEADIEAVFAKLSHFVLMHNGEDEAVERAVLRRRAGSTLSSRRDEALLLAIKAVCRRFHPLNWCRHAADEEAQDALAKPSEWVETGVERELDVHTRHVLATSAVSDVFRFGLLPQHVRRHIGSAHHGFGEPIAVSVIRLWARPRPTESNAGEFRLQHGEMGGGPFLGPATVGACAP